MHRVFVASEPFNLELSISLHEFSRWRVIKKDSTTLAIPPVDRLHTRVFAFPRVALHFQFHETPSIHHPSIKHTAPFSARNRSETSTP